MLYKLSIATSTSTLTTSAGATYPLPIGYSIANALIYLLLIVGFTFFYTYATFNPAEISSNIKKNGGFIPGIRTGKSTTEYLSSVISKLTIIWWIFLSTYSYNSNDGKIYNSRFGLWRNINTYYSWCSIRNNATIRVTSSNETL